MIKNQNDLESHAEIEIEDFDTGLMRLDRPSPVQVREEPPAESDGRDLLKFNERSAKEAIFGKDPGISVTDALDAPDASHGDAHTVLMR